MDSSKIILINSSTFFNCQSTDSNSFGGAIYINTNKLTELHYICGKNCISTNLGQFSFIRNTFYTNVSFLSINKCSPNFEGSFQSFRIDYSIQEINNFNSTYNLISIYSSISELNFSPLINLKFCTFLNTISLQHCCLNFAQSNSTLNFINFYNNSIIDGTIISSKNCTLINCNFKFNSILFKKGILFYLINCKFDIYNYTENTPIINNLLIGNFNTFNLIHLNTFLCIGNIYNLNKSFNLKFKLYLKFFFINYFFY